MDEAEDGLGHSGDLVVAEIEDREVRQTQWEIQWDLLYQVEGEVEAGMEADLVQDGGRDLVEQLGLVPQCSAQEVLVVELLVEPRSPDVGLAQLTVGQGGGATAAHYYQLEDISGNNNNILVFISMVGYGSRHGFEIFPSINDQYLPARLSSVPRYRES